MRYAIIGFIYGNAFSLLFWCGYFRTNATDWTIQADRDLLKMYVEFVHREYSAPVEAGPCETLSYAQKKSWENSQYRH